MKWLFFFFLIVNLLVFSLIRWGGEKGTINPHAREINASQMIIVTGKLAVAASETAPLAASAPDAGKALPASTPATTASASPVVEHVKQVCLRWSGVTLDQAEQARSRIRELGLAATENGGAENPKFWVYIPPLDSLELARKKAQQIADLGVEDYFVVNNGSKWQFSISLGIFSTREAGERRLEELKEKGVHSAILRDKDDALKPVTFVLKGVTPELRQKLDKANRQFRGAELREVGCK